MIMSSVLVRLLDTDRQAAIVNVMMAACIAIETPLNNTFAIKPYTSNIPVLRLTKQEQPYYQRFKNKKRKKS